MVSGWPKGERQPSLQRRSAPKTVRTERCHSARLANLFAASFGVTNNVFAYSLAGLPLYAAACSYAAYCCRRCTLLSASLLAVAFSGNSLLLFCHICKMVLPGGRTFFVLHSHGERARCNILPVIFSACLLLFEQASRWRRAGVASSDATRLLPFLCAIYYALCPSPSLPLASWLRFSSGRVRQPLPAACL